MDQGAQHFAARMQFDQGKLNALVGGQRLAEGFSLAGVLHGFVHAVLSRAQARGRLSDTVLVEEVLHDLQAAPLAAEDGAIRYPHIGESSHGRDRWAC